jgi:hypothetical protein
MPIHDWSRIDHGIFHDFHQSWTIELRNALNAGLLPPEFFALAEQSMSGPIPDVVALHRRGLESAPGRGGLLMADFPPQASFVGSVNDDVYAGKANRIVVHRELGDIVAVIEIVSPGNKSSRHALRAFVQKACDLIQAGIHMLVIDLLPPTPRDPHGIHGAIWDALSDEPFELPADKPLTVAAYFAGIPKTAYVEPVAVKSALPGAPLFLDSSMYVSAPLEASYQTTWQKCPAAVREFVERGKPK